MVTRRNNCARAIRSATPDAAIPGIKAAGAPESRPLWRSRKAISREAVNCERTFAVFDTAGVRARWPAMLRRSPSFARVIASASASSALSMSSGGSSRRGEGVGGVDPVFMEYGVGHGGLCIKMMKGSMAHRGANEIGLSTRKLGLPQRGVGTGSIVTAAPTTEAVRPSGRRASESVGRQGLPPFQSTGASLSTVSPKAT